MLLERLSEEIPSSAERIMTRTGESMPSFEINNPEDDLTREEPFGKACVDRRKRVDGLVGRSRKPENYVTTIRAARAIALPS
ncbi:MAG: hypothetical protein GY720_19925 [bacterium]|nr:hypothetical protein [bacterium]